MRSVAMPKTLLNTAVPGCCCVYIAALSHTEYEAQGNSQSVWSRQVAGVTAERTQPTTGRKSVAMMPRRLSPAHGKVYKPTLYMRSTTSNRNLSAS